MASRVITCSRSVRPLMHQFQPLKSIQIRSLHLQEYQSQTLLQEAGITIPRGRITKTVEDTEGAIKELKGQAFLKPQVLLGPRQYNIAKSVQDGNETAARLLGDQDKTSSRTDGLSASSQLYVEEAIDFDQKWHVAMTVGRENYCPVIRIQELPVSAEPLRPQKTLGPQTTFGFSLSTGISDSLVADISKSLHLPKDSSESLTQILRGLFKIFSEKEAINLEVDLLRVSDGQLVCADSRFSFDDAAQKRQPDVFALRDSDHEVREEVDAEKHGLVYVRMEGNIGNVVNGAGLAMATNDAISLYGGTSANFLDAGGQATKETMLQAFGIIMRDERVKAILVNIYGGITRCDMIAESIIAAASELGPLRVPMVARLQGTNSEAGLKLKPTLEYTFRQTSERQPEKQLNWQNSSVKPINGCIPSPCGASPMPARRFFTPESPNHGLAKNQNLGDHESKDTPEGYPAIEGEDESVEVLAME